MMAGLGGVLCAAMVLPVVAASGIAVRNTADKVTATSLNVSALPERSAIYDSDGHLITYVYGVDAGNGADYQGVDRQPVAYNQISQNMLTAIVAIEDDRYWQHGAIDFQGTFRAFVSDLQGNSVQGGSTIVQQYVKGVLVLANLGNTAAEQQATADNLSRKYAELRMALNVSHNVTRQDILAGYLNDAYYENSAWGIEAAAETYFGERASQLTLTQAALRPHHQPGDGTRAAQHRARADDADARAVRGGGEHGHGGATRPAPGTGAERMLGPYRGPGRVLLLVRDRHPAAGQDPRRDSP
jgi:membrane peptidoglycan carboxypeptidase